MIDKKTIYDSLYFFIKEDVFKLVRRRVILIDREEDYITRQLYAYTALYNITVDKSSTIVHYNLNNISDSLTIDSLNKKFDYKHYSTYFDLSMDELEDEMIDYYKYVKDDIELKQEPYIIFIEGLDKIKPVPYGTINDDSFIEFLEEKYTLLDFLNMYIICIL